MSGIQLNRITNANIYLDGNSLLGKAEEIKLPEINMLMTEHKALGMIGKFELPTGFDKLEGEVKWNSFYADVWRKLVDPFSFVTLQVRGSLDTYNSAGRVAQVPVVVIMTASFKKIPLGTFKQNDNAEFSSNFNCTHIEMKVDGASILELDVMSNTYKVDGVDKLETYRQNIGG
ncbi:MAG: phage major tail tube protein [Methylotenera sp.]|nr:phage major tail tube protein [Methylotenera sp.]